MKIKLPNDIELYYKKIGQGDPLLMLHGNGDSHKDLETLGIALANNYTVYLIDSRDHGKSLHTNEYFVYQDLAEDMDYFITQLQLKDVNIIGHSDGAIIATLLAMKKKTYLRKIILLGVTLNPEQMKEKWTKWIHEEYEKHNHPLFRLMVEEPQIAFEDLEQIEIPTFVVAAEDDVMPNKNYLEIAKRIPYSELCIVPNEDHMSYVNYTDKFAPTALEFLK